MAALHAVFEDRDGAVFAEIVFVDAAADEAAAFVEGNLSDKVSGQYDIIVANIVADIIMQFNPQVAQFLKPGCTYITGGIIDVREDEVLASFAANGFTVQQRFEDKGWLVFVLKHA